MLCVLLAHAYVIFVSIGDLLLPFPEPEPYDDSAAIEVVIVDDAVEGEEPPSERYTLTPPPLPRAPLEDPATDVVAAPPAGESQAPDFVDWPVEQKISAKRALAIEAEAERVAKMFSGPDGTWASLTKRERSRLKKFRWKPGVDGFEYDDKGNAIFHISEGCVVVNMAFIGCALGKAKVHGDLFKDMRLYFDEQRLPQNDDGNGTEPEALRPAN
jgi:hypothetical protein